MSSGTLPALVAPVVVIVVMLALLVPTLALLTGRSRRIPRGQALLGLGVVAYGITLLAYVLVPTPADPARFCERHHIEPNLVPLAFDDGFGSAIVQLVLNVALFVPLGVLLVGPARRAWPTATIAGFALSLLIELTQLTGVWFVYPCAYRHFDVDDILFNTIGAGLGALAVAHWRGRSASPPG